MKPPAPNQVDLDLLIERYRQGDQDAATELITRFAPYLEKWYKLLTQGRFRLRDEEIRHFLRMTINLDSISSAQIIARQLKAYEPADLKQELQVVLLQTALKHDNISANFRYQLKGRVQELLSDPLVFNYDRRTMLTEWQVEPQQSIDDSWVQGITCGKGFDQLTDRQRRIIQHTFWYGYSQERTADILQIPLRTVEREIRRIREVLKVHYHLK